MPRIIANSTLNASTVDILNVIRQNASPQYQAEVPKITKATEIPKVGESIYGTPGLANEFLSALINRIALVRVQSANFYNPYRELKKGYLEYGELIENIFVNIAKVEDYKAEKGAEREFKRTIPDVRSVFHVINWRVLYPVTIQDNDLMQAFRSAEGVTGLIARIVDSVYTAAEYDEFLLFKYLIIKAVTHGKTYMQNVAAETSAMAVAFRSISNKLPFMSKQYNNAGVLTNTPKERQVIFMDSQFNAQFDVEVLASAFNMDKADFMGRLYLIDDFTTFDNDRFKTIMENSDGIEPITAEELAGMENVKAVILDEEWFQVYDNNNKFTEKYVASGLYWNYFYHTWKTIASSPYANAVTFYVAADAAEDPATLTAEITAKDTSEEAVTLNVNADIEGVTKVTNNPKFVQTEKMTQDGIAITPDGAIKIPASQAATEITLVADLGGTTYTAAETITSTSAVGATVTLNKG